MLPCADGNGTKESATNLFLNYRKHCQEFGRVYPFTQQRFGREFRKLGFVRGRDSDGRSFYWYTKYNKAMSVAARAKELSMSVLVTKRDV
jgi:hypothetical protein